MDGWDARGGSSRGAGFGRHRLVPQHGECQQTPDRQGVAARGGRPLGPLYLMLDAWYMRGLLTHAVLRLTDRLCSASSRTHALTGSEISKRSAWYWQPIR